MLTTREKELSLRDLDIINKQEILKPNSEYSRSIFGCTDKVSVLLEIMGEMKKCMLPTSSGEGSIEFASRGIDVYSYDINSLSFYTEQLRIAATKALEYKDFLAFFYMFEEKEILGEKYYEDLREYLLPRARFLLDKMFSSMSGWDILEKLYDIVHVCPSFIVRPDHYMNMSQKMFDVNREEGFYRAKEVDLQSKIHFAQMDILDLESSEYKDERDFDMIFFSNILYFLPDESKNKFMGMLKELYLKYLRSGGALVNYFHSMDGLYRHLDFKPEYFDYDEARTNEIEELSQISDDFYEIGEGINGMGLYRNDIVHLIKRL